MRVAILDETDLVIGFDDRPDDHPCGPHEIAVSARLALRPWHAWFDRARGLFFVVARPDSGHHSVLP